MAMVVSQRKDEVINQNEAEDSTKISEKSEDENKSRSSSRNSNPSKRNTPVFMPQYQYSKDELMVISKLPLSLARPACLDPVHNNSSGKWDPENWFLLKRGDKVVATPEEGRLKRVRTEEAPLTHKKRTSDPRERIKEEKDEIILSPQRRSFGTGCHVIQHSTFSKRPGSPTDLRDSDSFRDRRIGSGRIVNRDREQREWERDHRDYNYNGGRTNDRRERFDQEDIEKEGKRYSNRYGRDRRGRGHERIDEEEPEWFSGGPTSQSETIELVGFDEAHGETENKKSKKSRKRENARRQNLKSEEEDKHESVSLMEKNEKSTRMDDKTKPASEEIPAQEKVVKSNSPEVSLSNGDDTKKESNVNFDFDDLLRLDWIPGLLQNESPQNENGNTEMGVSRFSQWFNRNSPSAEIQGSQNNSRRSSFHEELLNHVLSGIGDPGLLVQSPTPVCSEPYFSPISPALQHSSECPILPPHPVGDMGSKNFLELLKMGSENGPTNGDAARMPNASRSEKNIKEMEADLKRLVLGNAQSRPQEDMSAFDKLLQHMSDTAPSSISIGPLDKSKVLQEQDILQNMLGHSPASQPTHEKIVAPTSGNMAGHMQPPQQPQPVQSDLYKFLEQQQQQQQQQQHFELQQAKQQQFQNQSSKQGINPQGFTVDMLAKMLDARSHGPLSPAPAGGMSFGRNEPQSLNAMMQQQRQRELMSNVFKQQQMNQRSQNATLSHLMKCPMVKDVMGGPGAQTLGLPPTVAPGVSPRQSPLPPEAMHTQGRIPSPLVFGQQPPALSHAPAPIHPNHLAQAIAQNAANSNTLQVQNSMVFQRVPSPQELAVHTQTILQNALIKRKLEEQKENFRKRQEAQRTISPVIPKSGNSSSPMKGLSPTIAFTPTSVMRKMHSEKSEAPKNDALMNGAVKVPVSMENRCMESLQTNLKPPSASMNMTNVENFFNNSLRTEVGGHQYSQNGTPSVPRPVYGQCSINPPRPQHAINLTGGMPSNPAQGRPIVKGGNNQMGPAGEVGRPSQGLNKPMMSNKMFPNSNNQYSDRDQAMDAVSKFLEQQRLLQQQQQQQQQQKPINMLSQQHRQNSSPMPSVHATAGTFAYAPRAGHSINPPAGNMVRPVNFPLLRTVMQANPAVRNSQGVNLNQMSALGQIAALQQIQRTVTDNRPILARNYHPLALQQLLLNSQNPVAVQAQAGGGMVGAHGDGKHTHLVPGQSGAANRQSPVNLTKWFGNDVLKQKMPEMPPVSHQKALLVEDVERQQQHSTVVHN